MSNGATATAAKPSARKAREKVNPDETKADRFRRLGNKRVNTAIKAVSLIGNLTGSQYESTPEQRERIRDTLVKTVQATIRKLEGVDERDETFTL